MSRYKSRLIFSSPLTGACLLSLYCHYVPTATCTQAWRMPYSRFTESWPPQILCCPCSSSGSWLCFLCSHRSQTLLAAIRSCRLPWSGTDEDYSGFMRPCCCCMKHQTAHLNPFFLIYMLPSQLSGRRVPSSSSVLGSRHRVAGIPAGAFEGLCEEP